MSAPPRFREALRFWLKLGLISFGGPTGQIAIMHDELVEKKRWISQDHFLQALNFCMLLPGPEATQLATYCGWWLHGARGGIIAGVLFVLPSAILLWALSWGYVVFGSVPGVAAFFTGLKPVVTAIVVAAGIRLARKALPGRRQWLIAAGAFAGIFFFHLPFPVIVATAAVVGYFILDRSGRSLSQREYADREEDAGGKERPASWARAGRVVALSLILWWSPVLIAGLVRGWDDILVRQGLFFSKAAVVTFGGAYAVLPYVGQQAVDHFGWLTAPQMLDGLGLAETTPGPLIMVLQFVGFLGGWHAGSAHPLALATLGAAMTTWTTFVPCFLWVFLGAPHLASLRKNRGLAGALAGITASIVGVVFNLALWFGWQMYFPFGGGVDWFALGLSGAAFFVLHRGYGGIFSVVAAGGAIGLLWWWLLG